MHLRLDDLRKQARMLQMYEWERERTRTRSSGSTATFQASEVGTGAEEAAFMADHESRTAVGDPISPLD